MDEIACSSEDSYDVMSGSLVNPLIKPHFQSIESGIWWNYISGNIHFYILEFISSTHMLRIHILFHEPDPF